MQILKNLITYCCLVKGEQGEKLYVIYSKQNTAAKSLCLVIFGETNYVLKNVHLRY